mgnify:CR=1 FL=1
MFKVHMVAEPRWWEKFMTKRWVCYLRGHNWEAFCTDKPPVHWACLRCGEQRLQYESGGCVGWGGTYEDAFQEERLP